jgi:hypothetical protein
MPYTITCQPLNLHSGVQPGTVTKNTAAEAWTEVQMLQASDERVEIKDESGRTVSWQELRDLAAKAAN